MITFDLSPLAGEGFGPRIYLDALARTLQAASVEVALVGGERHSQSLMRTKVGVGSPTATVLASPTVASAFGRRRSLIAFDLRHLEAPGQFGNGQRLFRWLCWGRSFRRAPRVLAISEFTKAELVDRIGVAPEQVLVPVLAPSSLGLEATEEGDVQSGPVVAICHRRNKPAELALDVWRRAVAQGFVDRELVILIGERGEAPGAMSGPGWRAVRKLSSDATKTLLSKASAIMLLSDYEGYGLPALEAVAMQTPFLGTDLPPLREILGPEYPLVPFGDVESAACLLGRLAGKRGVDETLRDRLRARRDDLERESRQVAGELQAALAGGE